MSAGPRVSSFKPEKPKGLEVFLPFKLLADVAVPQPRMYHVKQTLAKVTSFSPWHE